MPPTDYSTAGFPAGSRLFATTHWSLIVAAVESEPALRAEALAKLCQSYWYPLYAFVRRTGRSPPDAQDLTQAFFARLLEKNYLDAAQPGRGKFRWFLIASFRHFLANEWDRATAQKRGGGRPPISLDELAAEDRYSRELAHELSPDKIYERSWALTLLEQARTRLRAEFVAMAKTERFDLLEQFLPGEDSELTYAEAGRLIGLTEGAVKSEVHRLKRHYRELLRTEVAHTVATPAEIDEEIRHLIAAIGT
jgi:RNA polymerase sigma-70 factor (ECF subfamily)